MNGGEQAVARCLLPDIWPIIFRVSVVRVRWLRFVDEQTFQHFAPVFGSVLAHGGVHDENGSAVHHQLSVSQKPVHRGAHRVVVVVGVGGDRDLANQSRQREQERKADRDLPADMLGARVWSERGRFGRHEQVEEGDVVSTLIRKLTRFAVLAHRDHFMAERFELFFASPAVADTVIDEKDLHHLLSLAISEMVCMRMIIMFSSPAASTSGPAFTRSKREANANVSCFWVLPR